MNKGIQGLQGEQGAPADIGLTVGIVAGAVLLLIAFYIIINVLAPKGIFKKAGADLSDSKNHYTEFVEEKHKTDILLQNDLRLRF